MRRLFVPLVALLLVAAVIFFSRTLLRDRNVLYEQKISPYPQPIEIPVTVGGKTYPMYLDTGAKMPFFDSSLQPLLSDPGETLGAAVVGKVMETKLYKAPPLTVGHWTLSPSQASAGDLQQLRQYTGHDVRGMVGVDALGDVILWLDYDHGTLRVLKSLPDAARQMQSVDLFPSDLIDRKTSLLAPIGDRKILFALDTGSNAAIGLSEKDFLYLEDWGFVKPKKQAGFAAGLAGAVTEHDALFKDGEILGISLKDMTASNIKTFNAIGLEILVNFNLIFDFPAGKLYYQRRNTQPPVNPGRALGAFIFFHDIGQPFIGKLQPGGGPAESAGLREGDNIVRLDTVPAHDLDPAQLYRICLEHAGQTIDVEVTRAGESKPVHTQLTLAKDAWAFPPENLGAAPAK